MRHVKTIMYYLVRKFNKAQEEYDDALEKHNRLVTATFNRKMRFRKRDVVHIEFIKKAVPLLKNIAVKRTKLGPLKRWYHLSDNKKLAKKLPQSLILKIAEFIPEKISM